MDSKKKKPQEGIMAADMSQLELKMRASLPEIVDVDMNTHISLVTGMERRAIKALRFSEVYGSEDNRDNLIEEVGKANVIKMTLDFLAQFPAVTQNIKFRKERSRMMLRALTRKVAERRNNQIVYDGSSFNFLHKGTLILTWDVTKDEVSDVEAGQYNDAPSTIYQRTLAREAIHEFRKMVLNV